MTMDDFGWMTAGFCAACLVAAFFAWRSGSTARSDLALLGGSGVVFGTASALLFAL